MLTYFMLFFIVLTRLLSLTSSSFGSSSSSSISLDGHSMDRIVVVVRHGERSPNDAYSWDKNRMNELWPLGYGFLTSEGKSRMYRTGLFLRRRYSKQFPGRYISPRDVYFRSSAVERCLETAQCIAAGLTPPVGPWIWRSGDIGQTWQPVPINTFPRYSDGLLNPSSICPYADGLFNEIPNSPVVQKFMKKYEELLRNVSIISQENLSNHRQVREFFDNLLTSKHHGHRIPKWVTPEIFSGLQEIHHASFRFDFSSQIVPELKKLRNGVLLNTIFKTLDPETTPNGKRITIFATHDSQVFHLHDALGFNVDNLHIKYGSMLIFEYDKSSDFFRLLMVNNESPEDSFHPKELEIPVSADNCHTNRTHSLSCLINQFKDLFMDQEQFTKICHGRNEFSLTNLFRTEL